jgi:chemotaxis protein CheX
VDVKYINPFVKSFCSVMPQLGFSQAVVGGISAKKREVANTGLLIVLGIVGDIKGNVIYAITLDDAKKIASMMMMGMPADELNDLVKSALSELANMLTAHAATALSDIGIRIEISTPTLLHGERMCVDLNSDQILCVRLFADQIAVDINISFA